MHLSAQLHECREQLNKTRTYAEVSRISAPEGDPGIERTNRSQNGSKGRTRVDTSAQTMFSLFFQRCFQDAPVLEVVDGGKAQDTRVL